MESKALRKIQFMPLSKYNSLTTKSKESLYMVEVQPDLNAFPDYTKGIAVAGGTTYTVGSGNIPEAGWFRIGLRDRSWHGQDPQLGISINGQWFQISYFCAFTMIYLTKGNTFYTNCGNGWGNKVHAHFFPLRKI